MILTRTKYRLCTTTLVLLHTGVCVWGTYESEYGYWLLRGTNATLLGVFQVTLFCPVRAEHC
jgi:hypothetical protein